MFSFHTALHAYRTREVYVCVQGHCREFKVVEYDGQHDGVFSVERESAPALVLNTRLIDSNLTAPFVIFDVIANCSTSPTDNSRFSVIRTQVGATVFCPYFKLEVCT